MSDQDSKYSASCSQGMEESEGDNDTENPDAGVSSVAASAPTTEGVSITRQQSLSASAPRFDWSSVAPASADLISHPVRRPGPASLLQLPQPQQQSQGNANLLSLLAQYNHMLANPPVAPPVASVPPPRPPQPPPPSIQSLLQFQNLPASLDSSLSTDPASPEPANTAAGDEQQALLGVILSLLRQFEDSSNPTGGTTAAVGTTPSYTTTATTTTPSYTPIAPAVDTTRPYNLHFQQQQQPPPTRPPPLSTGSTNFDENTLTLIYSLLGGLSQTPASSSSIHESSLPSTSTANSLGFPTQSSLLHSLAQAQQQPRLVDTSQQRSSAAAANAILQSFNSSLIQQQPPPAASPPIQFILMSASADSMRLSKFQTLLRQQLEYFVAGPEDVASTVKGRRRAISMGQMGIRCRHCKHLPLRTRAKGAFYFPTKLDGVYQAAQNMALSHVMGSCQSIDPSTKAELLRLKQIKQTPVGGKRYWAEACHAAGIYEAEDGLRLSTNR